MKNKMKKAINTLFMLLISLFAFAAFAADAPKMLASHSRNGYTVETWEIYPDDFLAVKTLVLVPDGAKAGQTPAVICMNRDRGSIEHLAGEPDPYGSINVDEGRKAYYAAKAGYVAMALALPGIANGCPDDIDSKDSRRRFLTLLNESGWTEEMLVKLEIERCVELLKAKPVVNRSKISVMGFGDGAIICKAAKGMAGVGVSDTILPNCECTPPHPSIPKPHKATGVRMMSERDYLPTRPDRRTEWTFAWAMKKRREKMSNPPPPPCLKDKETFAKWLPMKHKDWESRYDNTPETEFTLLKSEKRDGYTLKTYSFEPYPDLVIKTMILYPDSAKPGKTPVVACLPGSAGSFQGLAGEKGDPYMTRYPVRNKQAWWYAKCGMISVALDNPASANDAHDDVWAWKSQAWFNSHAGQVIVEHGKRLNQQIMITRQIAMCINFLKKDPLVDRKKIAVSGLSLGAQVVNSALSNPDVVACCYNDFAIFTSARPLCITRCMSNVVYGDGYGDGASQFFVMPPKYLLLNEGGAWKGHVEFVEKAYELAGCRDRLTIHQYDRYSYPPTRSWDKVNMMSARDYDYEDFFRHNNCDPYDHSFHPESALPWLCNIFYGSPELPKDIEVELYRAGAERERNPFQVYPPDARKGRLAVGPNDRELTDDRLVPELPGGKTGKTCTWVKMMIDRQKGK